MPEYNHDVINDLLDLEVKEEPELPVKPVGAAVALIKKGANSHLNGLDAMIRRRLDDNALKILGLNERHNDRNPATALMREKAEAILPEVFGEIITDDVIKSMIEEDKDQLQQLFKDKLYRALTDQIEKKASQIASNAAETLVLFYLEQAKAELKFDVADPSVGEDPLSMLIVADQVVEWMKEEGLDE